MDRCDSGASSADNPRTVHACVITRAPGLPGALTNTSMGAGYLCAAFLLPEPFL